MNLLFFNKSHCDERSEEAISFKNVRLPRLDISSLAMTKKSAHRHPRENGNPFVMFAMTFIVFSLLFSFPALAEDKEPIKIGEMYSYSTMPEWGFHHKNGWTMALQEINASGGILGRPVEVVSRDVKGEPAEAVRVAEELIDREKVDILLGACLDNVAMAVSNLAEKRRIPYIKTCGGSDSLIWDRKHRYFFRVGWTNTVSNAILAEFAASKGVKDWVTVAPDYEFGRNVVSVFKTQLEQRNSTVDFKKEYWIPVGKINAGATVRAVRKDNAEGLFCMLFGTDFVAFLREGKKLDLFNGKTVIGNVVGDTESLARLKDETPIGWNAFGFPKPKMDENPVLYAWMDKYEKNFSKSPSWFAIETYIAMYLIKDAYEKAEENDREKFIDSMEGASVKTPLSTVTMRAIDHNTDIGYFLGHTDIRDGKGVFVDAEWIPAESFFPSDEEVIKMQTGK